MWVLLTDVCSRNGCLNIHVAFNRPGFTGPFFACHLPVWDWDSVPQSSRRAATSLALMGSPELLQALRT